MHDRALGCENKKGREAQREVASCVLVLVLVLGPIQTTEQNTLYHTILVARSAGHQAPALPYPYNSARCSPTDPRLEAWCEYYY